MSPRRGQAMVFFALILPLVLLPVAAYAIESTSLSARQARLAEVASLVAIDAAQQLDVAQFRAGRGLAVDAGAGGATALADLANLEPGASLDSLNVTGPRLTVWIHETVPLRLAAFLRGAGVTLHASAIATLTPGYQVPS